MNNDKTFEFSIDRENMTINIKREYAAELPVVWDAYTKSDLLDQWWAPKPWKSRTKSMDFSEGGQWVYAMVGPNGEEQWSVANYEEIDDQKQFTITDGFSDDEGNINEEMPQSEWVVTFTDKGENTLVEFDISYDDIEQLDEIIKMGFKDGLRMAMQNLDELLTTIKK